MLYIILGLIIYGYDIVVNTAFHLSHGHNVELQKYSVNGKREELQLIGTDFSFAFNGGSPGFGELL